MVAVKLTLRALPVSDVPVMVMVLVKSAMLSKLFEHVHCGIFQVQARSLFQVRKPFQFPLVDRRGEHVRFLQSKIS